MHDPQLSGRSLLATFLPVSGVRAAVGGGLPLQHENMTCGGLWGRRPDSKGKWAGTYIGEAGHAVRSGISHVIGLRGLSLWQRLLVACLKIVAILGYHYGKWVAAAKSRATTAQQQASPKRHDVEEAVSAALTGCDSTRKPPGGWADPRAPC